MSCYKIILNEGRKESKVLAYVTSVSKALNYIDKFVIANCDINFETTEENYNYSDYLHKGVLKIVVSDIDNNIEIMNFLILKVNVL